MDWYLGFSMFIYKYDIHFTQKANGITFTMVFCIFSMCTFLCVLKPVCMEILKLIVNVNAFNAGLGR